MRKVYIEAKGTLLVPIPVTVEMIVTAEDDANLNDVVHRLAQGKRHSKADVSMDPTLVSIDANSDEIETLVEEQLDPGLIKLKVNDWKVNDSK